MRTINIDMELFSNDNLENRKKEAYQKALNNPENLSNWFYQMKEVLERKNSTIKIPETNVLRLGYAWFTWLVSDNYNDSTVNDFDSMIKTVFSKVIYKKDKLFIKTGVFSNKFDFNNTLTTLEGKVGEQYLNMFYTSMIYGVDYTNELVLRERIEPEKGVPTIYDGMPLHTEFRVFYDFDNNTVIGVANYWNPEVMKAKLKGEDLETYKNYESTLVDKYNKNKYKLVNELTQVLHNEKPLTGKWSIDIMMVGNEFWFIDMARMEKSALVAQMEVSKVQIEGTYTGLGIETKRTQTCKENKVNTTK